MAAANAGSAPNAVWRPAVLDLIFLSVHTCHRVEKSEESVAAANAGSAANTGVPVAGAPPASQQGGKLNDETMTVSLKHVCALGAGPGSSH